MPDFADMNDCTQGLHRRAKNPSSTLFNLKRGDVVRGGGIKIKAFYQKCMNDKINKQVQSSVPPLF